MARPPRVLACTLFVALAIGGRGPVRAEDTPALQGPAAWQKLVGNTVVAKTASGATYTDYYQADGTVRHQDGDGATSGTWSLDGDRVCLDYPDDDDRVCQSVTLAGTSGTFTEPGGAQDTFEVLPGNAKGL